MTKFKDRLNEALKLCDMKARELAEITGIKEATISQYRTGYSKPKEEKLNAIANALKVSPAWLLGLDVPMDNMLPREFLMGERIKAKRLENNLTMRDLGKLLDIGASAINKWEKGYVTNIGIETINKIAQALNCSATWLMGYNETVSDEEMEIINRYREADETTKDIVRRILRIII